jgi:hypothetical protein
MMVSLDLRAINAPLGLSDQGRRVNNDMTCACQPHEGRVIFSLDYE